MKKQIILLIMLLALNIGFSAVIDDFNRADSTTLNNGWTETENGVGQFQIVNDRFQYTLNVVGGAGNTHAQKTITSNPTRIDYFNIISNDNIDTKKQYLLLGSGDQSVFRNQGILIILSKVNLNGLAYYSDGWVGVNFEPVAGVEFDLSLRDIDYTSYTFNIYINDILYKSGATFRNNVNINTIDLQYAETTGELSGSFSVDCITTEGTTCETSPSEPVTIHTNIFATIGDSIVAGYDETETYSYFVTQSLNLLPEYTGITELNKGVSGACLSNHGECSDNNPTEDRIYNDVLTQKPRFIYLMPNVNDGNTYNNVDDTEYKNALGNVINNIIVNSSESQLILSTLTSYPTTSTYPMLKNTAFGAIAREFAVIHEVPFLEVHYLMNHNNSLIRSTSHPNKLGYIKINETLIDAILNPTQYIMTKDNFNIYHDCNNAVTVLNYTLISSNSNCETVNGDIDWTILKGISNNTWTIEKADEDFEFSIRNKFESNTNYEVYVNESLKYTVESNTQGDLLNLQFNQNELGVVVINKAPLTCVTTLPVNEYTLSSGYTFEMNVNYIKISDNENEYIFYF